MKEKKTMVRIAAFGLAALSLTVGAAFAAGAGTQADPLITLSYLNQTAIPAVVKQVEGKAAAYQDELAGTLDRSIQKHAAKMDALVGGEGANKHAATYAVVTLKKDQKLEMAAGCEVLLRGGAAQCVSGSNAGLINTTTGSVLNNGGTLEANHLYITMVAGQSIKATADTNLLVRGGYTIA